VFCFPVVRPAFPRPSPLILPSFCQFCCHSLYVPPPRELACERARRTDLMGTGVTCRCGQREAQRLGNKRASAVLRCSSCKSARGTTQQLLYTPSRASVKSCVESSSNHPHSLVSPLPPRDLPLYLPLPSTAVSLPQVSSAPFDHERDENRSERLTIAPWGKCRSAGASFCVADRFGLAAAVGHGCACPGAGGCRCCPGSGRHTGADGRSGVSGSRRGG